MTLFAECGCLIRTAFCFAGHPVAALLCNVSERSLCQRELYQRQENGG